MLKTWMIHVRPLQLKIQSLSTSPNDTPADPTRRQTMGRNRGYHPAPQPMAMRSGVVFAPRYHLQPASSRRGANDHLSLGVHIHRVEYRWAYCLVGFPKPPSAACGAAAYRPLYSRTIALRGEHVPCTDKSWHLLQVTCQSNPGYFDA